MRILAMVNIIVLFFFNTMYSQQKFLSEVDLKYKIRPKTGKVSYALNSRYRNTFYDFNEFDFKTNFLELSSSSSFTFNKNHSFSIRTQYRFKKLFHNEATDELRLTYQFDFKSSYKMFSFQSRIRTEQRFMNFMNLRNRFLIGIGYNFNSDKELKKRFSLKLNTESLWSIFKDKSPVYDQRMSLIFTKPLFRTVDFKLKPQYRYLDYTNNPRGVFYFYSTLSFHFR